MIEPAGADACDMLANLHARAFDKPWTAPELAKLLANPAVEVNVVDPLLRRGYRFTGTASVHVDDDVFARGIEFYERRGTVRARERIRSIVIVTVERAAPVVSPAYDLGATEDELRDLHLERYTQRAQEHRTRPR